MPRAITQANDGVDHRSRLRKPTATQLVHGELRERPYRMHQPLVLVRTQVEIHELPVASMCRIDSALLSECPCFAAQGRCSRLAQRAMPAGTLEEQHRVEHGFSLVVTPEITQDAAQVHSNLRPRERDGMVASTLACFERVSVHPRSPLKVALRCALRAGRECSVSLTDTKSIGAVHDVPRRPV